MGTIKNFKKREGFFGSLYSEKLFENLIYILQISLFRICFIYSGSRGKFSPPTHDLRTSLCNEKILVSANFYFYTREKSCISISLIENLQRACQRKVVHYFLFFKEYVLHQTIEPKTAYEMGTILLYNRILS